MVPSPLGGGACRRWRRRRPVLSFDFRGSGNYPFQAQELSQIVVWQSTTLKFVPISWPGFVNLSDLILSY